MKNIKDTFNQNKIIHFALMIGQIMIAIMLFAVVGSEEKEGFYFTFLLVPCFVSVMTMILSEFVYKTQLRGLDLSGMSLEEKMTNFRTISIVRWALLEGGNLMVIIFAWLTGKIWLLLFFVVSLFLLYLARPSLETFAKDFKLSRDDESKIRNALR